MPKEKPRQGIYKSFKSKASRFSQILDKPLVKICEPAKKRPSAVAELMRSTIDINKLKTSLKNMSDSQCSFERFKKQFLDEKWTVDRIHKEDEGGYMSVLYRNDIKRQFVYAFKGNTRLSQSLDLNDLFHAHSDKQTNIDSFFYSCLANLSLASQTEHLYKYVNECVVLSKELNYSLSFTGYSFGAWLAEQSVYFCHNDFDCEDVRAVTFESPGSFEYLERLNIRNVYSTETKFDLDQLDIRTYVTQPNFVNTSNKHVGKVFRVIVGESENEEETRDYVRGMHEFVTDLIAKTPTIYFRMKLNDFYQNKIKDKINEFAFYVNGFKSLFVNGIFLKCLLEIKGFYSVFIRLS